MIPHMGVTRSIFYLFVIGWISSLSGCMLIDLKKEIAEIEQLYGIGGKVNNKSSHDAPVIMVLFSGEKTERKIIDYSLVEESGHYSFLVPQGYYHIGAFEDRNQNSTLDAGEYGAYYGAPDKIHISSDILAKEGVKGKGGLDFTITKPDGIKENFPISLEVETLNKKSFVKVGTVTTLDDKIFDQENGSLGYWKPLTFLEEFGHGIYFLTPYDSKKIPILFVHGALGTPNGWKTIVNNLDQNRFQPWFYYYPSGFRLDMIGRGLNNIVKELHKTHKFKRLFVFAHSMGGMVSRSFIMNNMIDDGNKYIKMFVSVSTPWNGHKASAKGVEQAPVSVPSWYDMVPDSEFIQTIFDSDLPEDVAYYLFFTFRGNFSFFIDNNDGTVEISSQLDPRAQRDADRLFGYDENHGSILESKSLIDQFNTVLDIGGGRLKGISKKKYYSN